MSLFTDLRDVFTAYANRIKGLAAADEQIKADLATLADITPIPDNSDLNNYGETGLYSIEYGNYTILNYPPAAVAGSYLEVRKLTTGYVGQKLTIPGNGKVFTRSRFSNGNWNDWVPIAQNSESEFSPEAKIKLIELLKHVPWKDSGEETRFENFIEALGVSVVDYNILIGKNIALSTLSDNPKDVQYFIDSTDNTKRALLFANTGTHCMTLQDSTPTTYYPVKIPASVKKIWFDNAKENNFAVNIHIIYYDSTIGGYKRLLTGKVYDTHEMGNWKYDDGNGGIWKLDISDYNDGNLFMLGTFAKSHSSTIRTDSEGNQYPQAVLDTEDIDSTISNVVLRMI